MFLAHVTAAMFQDVNELSGEETPAPKAKAKTRSTKPKGTEAAKAKAKGSSAKKTGAGNHGEKKRNTAKAAASPSKRVAKRPAASVGEPEEEPSKGKGKKRPGGAESAKKGAEKALRVWKYTYPNGCWGFKLNTTKKEVMRVGGNKSVCSCLQC